MGMLLCVFLLVSSAWADLNSPEMTGEEYRQYLEESYDFRTADEDLNNIYNQLMSVLNESEKNGLREDQKKWVIKRDNEAFSEAPKGVELYFDSLVKLTEERKSELESRLVKLKNNSVNSEVLPIPPPPIEERRAQSPAENQNSQQQAESSTNNIVQKTESWASFILMMTIIGIIFYFLYRNKQKQMKKQMNPDYNPVYRQSDMLINPVPYQANQGQSNQAQCPRCGSTNLQALNQQVKVKRSAGYQMLMGALFALTCGVLWLLLALFRKKVVQTYVVCLNCGYKRLL